MPPTSGRSARPMSSNQPSLMRGPSSLQDGDHAAPAVDADALAILDARGWRCRCRPRPAIRIRAPRWPRGSSSRRCPTPRPGSSGRSAPRSGWSPGRPGCRRGCRRAISSTERTTRAGPSTTPLEAAKPFTSLEGGPSLACSHASRLSRVMPHSITMADRRSHRAPGPSAGGRLVLGPFLQCRAPFRDDGRPVLWSAWLAAVDHAFIKSMMAASSS